MEKLVGDIFLGLKFVKLEILTTSFIYFLHEELGESRARSLGLKGSISISTTEGAISFLIPGPSFQSPVTLNLVRSNLCFHLSV